MEDIRKIIIECMDEALFDEERITNTDAKELVNKRQNFVGSHIYGEDIGDVGKLYVAYSYGEQHPLYVWYKGRWYYNTDKYMVDGEPNIWTDKHLKLLRPNEKVQGRTGGALKDLIRKFKKKYSVGYNSHTDLVPGEK